MDLVEFLRARLDEQEDRHAADWWQECKVCREPMPCRHMRQIDATRRIMGRHSRKGTGSFPNACTGCGAEGPNDWPRTEHINECPELRDLAAVYADRFDYDDEWLPED